MVNFVNSTFMEKKGEADFNFIQHPAQTIEYFRSLNFQRIFIYGMDAC